MRPRRNILRFLTDESGAAAVEFALVSVFFLGLTVGTLDVSRMLWEIGTCKAATRAAARYAAVHDPVAQDLVDFNAVTALSLYPGDPISATAVASHTCTSSGCTCGSTGYCGSTGLNQTEFDNIVAIMQGHFGGLEPENIVVSYTPVGLGLAGNPYGPDVEPLITVRLCQEGDSGCTPMVFSPGVLQAFGISPFNVPAVASSLSGEDLCSDPNPSNC